MSAGDAREGIIRGKAARARLGGKLAGLSLPRQIAVIAFWPFLEQLLSFFVTSSDLFIATKIGVDAQDTINISDGMGAVVFIMWFGFVIQGAIMMGATAIVSRMTGARDYPQAQHGLHQAAMLGLLAGTISCGLLFTCSDFMVTHVLTMNETARPTPCNTFIWPHLRPRSAAWSLPSMPPCEAPETRGFPSGS